MAIASLVLGIVGIIFSIFTGWIGIILGLVGIILGAVFMSQAKKTGQPTGMAVAGLVLSIIAVIIGVLVMACAVCVVAGAESALEAAAYGYY